MLFGKHPKLVLGDLKPSFYTAAYNSNHLQPRNLIKKYVKEPTYIQVSILNRDSTIYTCGILPADNVTTLL